MSNKEDTFTYDKTRRQICPLSGGKDSTALAIFLQGKVPNLEYVFCDTGKELQETYEYLDKLQGFLGKKIIRLGGEGTFDYLLAKHSNFLPSPMARWCTNQMKIKPFEKYIGKDLIESYVGIRADEERKGYISSKKNILTRYPFKEYGIDLAGVNKILKEAGVGLPKYYEWRTRSGCYFCFYQRKIEWVGLLERHPDLFKKAKEYEKLSYKNGGKSFTWLRDISLEELERDAEKIKKKHETKMEIERRKNSQRDLFKEVVSSEEEDDPCLICDL